MLNTLGRAPNAARHAEANRATNDGTDAKHNLKYVVESTEYPLYIMCTRRGSGQSSPHWHGASGGVLPATERGAPYTLESWKLFVVRALAPGKAIVHLY